MRYDETLKKTQVEQYYNRASAYAICFENDIPKSTFYTYYRRHNSVFQMHIFCCAVSE